MRDETTWSYNRPKCHLDEDSMEDIKSIIEVFDEFGGAPKTHSQRADLIEPLGWEIEKRASFESDGMGRAVAFDAWSNGIALEHESMEAMRAMWHLTKAQAVADGHHNEDFDVDVCVMLVPEGSISSGGHGSCVRRVQEGVKSILEPSTGFDLPVYVVEYI